MDLEDDLTWLAERYTVCVTRNGDRWHVDLYGENDHWEMGPGASFEGTQSKGHWDFDWLIARAREWAETPLAKDLDGRDWLRLCEAAAKLGVPARDLIRKGARELLDRLDREASGTEPVSQSGR